MMRLPTTSLLSIPLLSLSVLAVPRFNIQNAGQYPLVLAESETDAQASFRPVQIEYEQCKSTGSVSSITIDKCDGGEGSSASPCEFHFGRNYTITISYASTITSASPRSNVIAADRKEHYPYSGQSFSACSYTSCPIYASPASQPETYVYEFHTLHSPFDHLTFDITDGIHGESLFCAGFPAIFVDHSMPVQPDGDQRRSRVMRGVSQTLPFGGLKPREHA